MTRAKILLVDDDPRVVEVLPVVLAEAGFDLTIARTGSEALTMLREMPGTWAAAIIDFHMPPPDGVSLIREIAAWPGCFGLRGIILYTSEPRQAPELHGLEEIKNGALNLLYVHKSGKSLKTLKAALMALTAAPRWS